MTPAAYNVVHQPHRILSTTAMRTRLALLTCFAALALTASPAFAEGTGAPPAPAAHQPPPAPPAPAPPAPAPEARKEEEAEKAKASLIARLRGYIKGTGAMANDIAGLQQQVTTLQARITELESGATLKALQDENASMRADIAEFMTVAQTHGLLTESGTAPAATPSPKSPMGKAAAQAVAGAVSTQIAALGVPVTQLPAAANHNGPAATLAEVEEQLKAAKNPAERQAILAKNKALIMSSN